MSHVSQILKQRYTILEQHFLTLTVVNANLNKLKTFPKLFCFFCQNCKYRPIQIQFQKILVYNFLILKFPDKSTITILKLILELYTVKPVLNPLGPKKVTD